MPDLSFDSGHRCYVCGHPILEGQRSALKLEHQPNGEAHPLGGEGVKGKWHLAHANPMDHLPTLHPLLAEDLSKEGVKLTVQHWRKKERERAARLVMEEELPLDWFLSSIEQEAAETARLKLAQRIREGD